MLKKLGLIRRRTNETRISDIRSLSTGQSPFKRLTGTGTVQIDSTGAGGLLRINGVDDYNSLANTTRIQKQKVKA